MHELLYLHIMTCLFLHLSSYAIVHCGNNILNIFMAIRLSSLPISILYSFRAQFLLLSFSSTVTVTDQTTTEMNVASHDSFQESMSF